VPSIIDSLEVKVSIQPDGRRIAKRKGVIARWGLKEAWSKAAARWTRTDNEAYPPDERATDRESTAINDRVVNFGGRA